VLEAQGRAQAAERLAGVHARTGAVGPRRARPVEAVEQAGEAVLLGQKRHVPHPHHGVLQVRGQYLEVLLVEGEKLERSHGGGRGSSTVVTRGRGSRRQIPAAPLRCNRMGFTGAPLTTV
jgi:hypothetical protein